MYCFQKVKPGNPQSVHDPEHYFLKVEPGPPIGPESRALFPKSGTLTPIVPGSLALFPKSGTSAPQYAHYSLQFFEKWN
jgi:hypothetical protein